MAPHARLPPAIASAGRAAGALAAAGLLAAAVAGCEPDSPGTGGLAEKAESTVSTLLQACARSDGEAALGLLTPPARAALISSDSVIAGCDRVLDLGVEHELEGHTVFGEAVVESVDVNDDLGTATIRAKSGATSEVELENAGDQWLVTNPPL